MRYYRFTTNNEGVYAAGKRLLPEELIDEAWEKRKWLKKPDLPSGEYQFLFTKKGKEKYEETLFHVHQKYLENIVCHTVESDTIGEVVYQDEYQIVCKK